MHEAVSNRDSLKYEQLRLGYNGACRNLFPKVILRPETTKDVAIAVKVANKLGLKVIIPDIGGLTFMQLNI